MCSSFQEVASFIRHGAEVLCEPNGYAQYTPVKDSLGQTSLLIEYGVSKQQGFGTISTRKLVQISLDKGCEGRLHGSALYTSHLFCLYMGAVPVDHEVDYMSNYWGFNGMEAIKTFPAIKEKIIHNKTLTSNDKQKIDTLKKILKHHHGSDKEFSNQELIENEEVLNQLNDKKISYNTHVFIPLLLRILERSLPGERPNTSYIGKVDMHLSEMGIERWKKCIEEDTPFIPFKSLEHLQCYATPEDAVRLKEIMARRQEGKDHEQSH